ncbi:aminotransferase class V-fold PLP-dependent enzyme [Mariniblastus sp.]|jgi:aspartate aminotransferase-like enzyme|nr:aminotransferase class V-fold PLP-dependent enzyme [Mariniblastus sp.]MDB4756412.1 aminotransferase class V-fold PLP-dependent enzyme [Mariniblastus sp.]
MPSLLPEVDPDGLLEYSVVYTDRALNHMSASFQEVMNDISKKLKSVYNARAIAIIPGSGTFAMESVARQFASGQKCLIIRNGWFSFRWTQILEMGNIASESLVMKATPLGSDPCSAFVPPPIESVVAAIKREKPAVVFAPHVETSAGMMLPNSYLTAIGEAVRNEGGLFVLDCIASGTVWIDMEACGVDVLITAPQKGWSGSPCSGLVMMGERAQEKLEGSQSSSFSCDLKKWYQIMAAYENGGHAYHATMPTDGLKQFRNVINEMELVGFATLHNRQLELGRQIRQLLVAGGFASVAGDGFQAPGVVVCFTNDPEIKSGKKFSAAGIQIAPGVPLKCDEPKDFQTFRVGLFGIDKLNNVEKTISTFASALQKVV